MFINWTVVCVCVLNYTWSPQVLFSFILLKKDLVYVFIIQVLYKFVNNIGVKDLFIYIQITIIMAVKNDKMTFDDLLRRIECLFLQLCKKNSVK